MDAGDHATNNLTAMIDCKAGTTAKGQNLLANKFCPFAVVPACNQFGLIMIIIVIVIIIIMIMIMIMMMMMMIIINNDIISIQLIWLY